MSKTEGISVEDQIKVGSRIKAILNTKERKISS